MKRENSDSHPYWEDDFDRKKKKRSSLKGNYKRKDKYKNNYFNDEY